MKVLTASHCSKPTLTDNEIGRGFLLLDITVKSGCEDGWILAPTWNMVNDVKSGKISWDIFVDKYFELVYKRFQKPMRAKENILFASHLILVCYCPSADRCHRVLSAQFLEEYYGAKYYGEYNGEKQIIHK